MRSPMLLLSVVAVVVVTRAVSAETPPGPLTPSERLAGRMRSAPKVVTSPTGRFRVRGADTLETMDLASWAGDLAKQVERALRVPLPPVSQHNVLIDIVPAGENQPAGVRRSQTFSSGVLSQRLVVVGYEDADYADTERALCRLLLDAYVVSRWDPGDNGGNLSGVPAWIAIGASQSLHPGRRERDGLETVALWEEGKLGSVADVLASASEESLPAAVCGFLVRWLVGLPGERPCFEEIFDRLAAGKTITAAWLVTCVSGCESVVDLDETWDLRLLRERRVVYVLHKPGTISDSVLVRLRSELLLRPCDYGIRLGDGPKRALTFSDLIEQRDAEWIRRAADGKCASLRLMAVGREKRLGQVVEAYCAFLEALGERKSPAVLESLLGEAERGLAELAAGMAES